MWCRNQRTQKCFLPARDGPNAAEILEIIGMGYFPYLQSIISSTAYLYLESKHGMNIIRSGREKSPKHRFDVIDALFCYKVLDPSPGRIHLFPTTSSQPASTILNQTWWALIPHTLRAWSWGNYCEKDSFMNLAKKGLDAYQESQSHQSQQSHHSNNNDEERRDNDNEGGQYKDTRHHESYSPDSTHLRIHIHPTVHLWPATVDQDEVVNKAQQHAGDSGNSDFFSSAMSHVMGRKVDLISVPISPHRTNPSSLERTTRNCERGACYQRPPRSLFQGQCWQPGF